MLHGYYYTTCSSSALWMFTYRPKIVILHRMRAYWKKMSERQKIVFGAGVALYTLSWIGALTGAFDAIAWLDIPFHFLGGVLLGLFIIDVFAESLKAERGIWHDAVIILGATLLVGYVWEVYEYTLTLFFGNFFAARGIDCCIGTVFDTLKDLFMDSLGAAMVFMIVRNRNKKSPLFR